AKIQSRFSKSNRHTVWITFMPNGTGAESITGYFCTCKCGSRTIGCCGHIASVLWYFGYARHNKENLPKRKSLVGGIMDCAAAFANTLDPDLENGKLNVMCVCNTS